MQRTRRALLASTGVALLAGCVSIDPDGSDSGGGGGTTATDATTATPTSTPTETAELVPEPTPEPEPAPTPESTPTPTTVVDRTMTILEDEYETWDVSLSEQSEVGVRFTVRDGPAIDFVFTTQSEFEQFEDGNRFRYNSNLSFLDSAGGQNQTSLPAGSYVLLVDNTEGIDASPPQNYDEDPAEVDLTCRYVASE